MPTRKRTKSYHHGDLREALVNAGTALLEEQGCRVSPCVNAPGAPACLTPHRPTILQPPMTFWPRSRRAASSALSRRSAERRTMPEELPWPGWKRWAGPMSPLRSPIPLCTDSCFGWALAPCDHRISDPQRPRRGSNYAKALLPCSDRGAGTRLSPRPPPCGRWSMARQPFFWTANCRRGQRRVPIRRLRSCRRCRVCCVRPEDVDAAVAFRLDERLREEYEWREEAGSRSRRRKAG